MIYSLIIYLFPPPTTSKVFFFFSNFCVLFDQTLFSTGKGFYCVNRAIQAPFIVRHFTALLEPAPQKSRRRTGRGEESMPLSSMVTTRFLLENNQEETSSGAGHTLGMQQSFLGFIPTVNGYVLESSSEGDPESGPAWSAFLSTGQPPGPGEGPRGSVKVKFKVEIA